MSLVVQEPAVSIWYYDHNEETLYRTQFFQEEERITSYVRDKWLGAGIAGCVFHLHRK